MESAALHNSKLPASPGNCQSTDKEDGAQTDGMTGTRVHGQIVWDVAWHPERESALAGHALAWKDLTFVLSP